MFDFERIFSSTFDIFVSVRQCQVWHHVDGFQILCESPENVQLIADFVVIRMDVDCKCENGEERYNHGLRGNRLLCAAEFVAHLIQNQDFGSSAKTLDNFGAKNIIRPNRNQNFASRGVPEKRN